MIINYEIMEIAKEEAIRKFKLLLKHKKEMEEGAKKYYGLDLKSTFGKA